MNKPPLVSIIVPCYNYGRYVGDTLDSVLAQSYTNWECLVVDDGSKDNSAEVVKRYAQKDSRIKYIYQENKGLPGARNTGIIQAKGEYIMVLDADDLIQPRKIELQVNCFEDHPDVDFTYSGVRYFMDGTPHQLRYSADWRNRPWALDKSGMGKQLLKYMIISDVILSHQPLIKRDALFRVGLYKEHLRSCEDWEFYLRCMYNDLVIRYVDEPKTLALIRIHPSSMTRNRTVMVNHMIKVRGLLAKAIDDPKLLSLNERFLISDIVELAIVKRQFEGKAAALDVLKIANQTRSSFRLFLFGILVRISPPKFNLFLLKIVRTLMKKWYYLKLG